LRSFAGESARVPAGSHGLVLLPYFEGERTPNVPDGTGVWFAINKRTFEAGHFARASMEGVTMGMNYGFAAIGGVGRQPNANSGDRRRRKVKGLAPDNGRHPQHGSGHGVKVSEAAAYGAALQALWCWRLQEGEKVSISDITDKFVEVNAEESAYPEQANVAAYQELQALQDEMSAAFAGRFWASIVGL